MKTISPLLTPLDETGRILGRVGRTTVYSLIAEGKLERVKIGRRSFVTVESLEAYVAQLKADGVPDPVPAA